jgi:hypothetical protein
MALRKSNNFRVVESIVEIDVSTNKLKGAIAFIDLADKDTVLDGNGRWFAQDVGAGKLYVCRHVPVAPYKTRLIYLHRLLLNVPLIDHRDRNGLNNCRSNIRPASRSANGHNLVSRRGSSKFKGVYLRNDTKKWQARITIDGETYQLGCFSSETDAALAYDKISTEKMGEFSRKNIGENYAVHI